MEPNNLEGRSRGSSFRRRALTLVGVSALTLSGVGAAVFGASQAFAATTPAVTVTSSSYLIGSGAVGNLAVSASNLTSLKSAIYTVGFTATDGFAAADTLNVTLSSAASSGVTGTLTDSTTGAVQSVAITAEVAGTAIPITVGSKISAGDTVSLVFAGVTEGAATTTANVVVSTTADSIPVTSANYTISAGTTALVPKASVSTAVASATGVTWTLGTFGVYDNTTPATKTLPLGATLMVAIPGSQLTTAPLTNYVITDTPSSGSATTQNPTSATLVAGHTDEVNLVTSAAINVGDTITITVSSVNNPTANPVTPTLTITAVSGDAYVVVDPGTAINNGNNEANIAFNAVTISGTLTSVTGVSITPSPTAASTSTVNNTSTFTVGFTSTSVVAANGSITVQLAPLEAIAAASDEVVVTDTTAGTSNNIAAGTVPTKSTSPTSTTTNVISVAPGIAFAKGDVVSVQIFGVVNPQTSGSYTGQVSTSGDSTAVSASYTLTNPSTTLTKVTVALSSSAAGASSTYTITNLEASAALAGGGGFSIGTSAASATQFPTLGSAYQITDLTNSAGSGAAATVGANSGGFNGVDITTTNSIAKNDMLTITISGMINPAAIGSYMLQFSSPMEAATVAVAPTVTTAPNAATTGSSGSLVNVSGTIYVYAGGVAFGIPTPAEFNAISASVGNPTVVTASSVTTTGTVQPGTLVQVVGSPQINVVGSGNTYYGFSTASQFLSDGYSFANVIQVPSFGSLTVGSGTTPSAASTGANGALVNVSGTIYVYAGGVAIGIPTPAVFNSISAAEGNPTVVTASSVTITGNMAAGTLVQVVGSPQVNVVTSTGTQVGFATASEFIGDGYSWAKVVMIP